jgi:hypothetical protein
MLSTGPPARKRSGPVDLLSFQPSCMRGQPLAVALPDRSAPASKSPEEIANLMSRSPKAIRKVAIRLGISLSKNKRRPARANG